MYWYKVTRWNNEGEIIESAAYRIPICIEVLVSAYVSLTDDWHHLLLEEFNSKNERIMHYSIIK